MNNKLNRSLIKKQTGVILIFVLVILLVLTMLIIGSMNSANTQVLMTGNTQYNTQAMNAAENTLRFAENTINQFSVSGSSIPVSGYYNLKNNNTSAIDFKSFKWNSNTAATRTMGNQQSLYVIEYTGRIPLNGASIAITQNNNVIGDEGHLYRITARSTSARGAVRIVQSVFVTTVAPL